MARNLLTLKAIEADKKPKLRDGDGLWLHKSKAGSRYWVFIFVRFGLRREMGLGPYGSGTGQVSLIAARAKADEIRTILGRGGDPFNEMEERKNQVRPATFGEVADEYIETMKTQWRGAKTYDAWKRFADTYVKSIRKIPVAGVDTDDVVRVLRPMWHTKPETATKVRERIKIVLDHAKARKLRSGDNPAEWVGNLKEILPTHQANVRGNHPAMPYADAPAFMKKLRTIETIAARCLEFCILNANRPGEARGARWDEIDIEVGVWTIPGPRMKEEKEHRIPLSSRAVEIVKQMMTLRSNDLVFPGMKKDRPLSDMTLTKVLKKNGGAAASVHGFRSTFRDWASEETQHQREVAEAALAHAVGDQTERAYRRGDALQKRRTLMEDWKKYLD